VTGLFDSDARLLRLCFQVAARARAEGNLPFGCVIADEDGNVLIEQANMALVPRRDPTAHAETLAAGLAARCYEPAQLARFSLYSSAEPCAMCAGAIYWAGIGRVVYGLTERDLLGITGDHLDNPTMDLPCRAVLSSGQRRIEVLGPELVDEALEVFAGYFA
jgi:tRNA(Arg) A34 adenosine deaminase TadA